MCIHTHLHYVCLQVYTYDYAPAKLPTRSTHDRTSAFDRVPRLPPPPPPATTTTTSTTSTATFGIAVAATITLTIIILASTSIPPLR